MIKSVRMKCQLIKNDKLMYHKNHEKMYHGTTKILSSTSVSSVDDDDNKIFFAPNQHIYEYRSCLWTVLLRLQTPCKLTVQSVSAKRKCLISGSGLWPLESAVAAGT